METLLWTQLTPHAVPLFAVGVLLFVLGAAILAREGLSEVSAAFFFLTACASIWLVSMSLVIGSRTEAVATAWTRIEHAGVCFIPSAVYLFTLAVVKRLRRFRRSAFASLVVSAVFYTALLAGAPFLAGVWRYSWGYYPRYGILSFVFLAYFAALLGGSLRLYWIAFRESRIVVHKKRLRAFLAAFSLGYLASIDFLPAYGVPVYPLGFTAAFAFLVITALAIWRYHLVDITPAFAARKIMDGMRDALFVLDPDGNLRLVNEAACRLLKKNESDLAGKPVRTAFDPLVTPEAFAALLSAGDLADYEITFEADGEMRRLLVSASTIGDPAGHAVAALLIARDVTERKKLESRFAQFQQVETLTTLAGAIARELNSELLPLLKKIDEAMHACESSHAAYRPLSEAAHSAQKATDTLRRLLNFSRYETNARNDVHPDQVLRELQGVLPDLLPISILTDVSWEGGLWSVHANKADLESAVMNLITNARDAMPRGGRLILRAKNLVLDDKSVKNGHVPGPYVAISVRDTGDGIAPDLIQRIFEPFFTTKRNGPGSGLGLSTVQNILRDLKGWVDVQSEPGKGTTFELFFPAVSG